ncbi:MAG: ATP-dependent metallopeptidase FtsH/Yme1/Tma family protein, partial [Deltaproteobacteria bacterium]
MKKFKTLIVWGGFVIAFVALFALMNSRNNGSQVPFPTFLSDVAADRVAEIQVTGREIVVWRSDSGQKYVTEGALSPGLFKTLAEHDVAVNYGKESGGVQTVLLIALPIVLLLALLVFFLRKAQG